MTILDDVEPDGSDVEFEWECEVCHEMTRDNWIIARGWASAQCRRCRGYVVTTSEAARLEHEQKMDCFQ